MKLTADLHLRRGTLRLDAGFVAAPGSTVALLGPNGAGKTSALRCLAGLLRLDAGSITLGERRLDGGPGGPFVPPEHRGIGLLFQDHLLFPQQTALQNVAYGVRGASRKQARAIAGAWLERVGIATPELRPAQLSGGQAQRVALARALASNPSALLLDEPLAAIDASARFELRRLLREHLRDFPGPRLLVVHDIADALALADRLVVLEQGQLVQAGSINDLACRPRSRYVADLLGVNSFVGDCRDGHVRLGAASLTVATATTGEVLITVHPRAVSLFRSRPEGSPRNVWLAPVLGLEHQLERVRVELGGALPVVAEVTRAAVDELRLADGGEVWVAIKATELVVTAR
ncbi:MAG: ABC transporter ATP-binding protein [Planctomycetes bacterium]|nr:ABC transporter ATP-binding protein [Planctomycetota bacterium]